MRLHADEAETFHAGRKARVDNSPKSENPHERGIRRWLWAFGWIEADQDIRLKPEPTPEKPDPTFARYGIVCRVNPSNPSPVLIRARAGETI